MIVFRGQIYPYFSNKFNKSPPKNKSKVNSVGKTIIYHLICTAEFLVHNCYALQARCKLKMGLLTSYVPNLGIALRM